MTSNSESPRRHIRRVRYPDPNPRSRTRRSDRAKAAHNLSENMHRFTPAERDQILEAFDNRPHGQTVAMFCAHWTADTGIPLSERTIRSWRALQRERTAPDVVARQSLIEVRALLHDLLERVEHALAGELAESIRPGAAGDDDKQRHRSPAASAGPSRATAPPPPPPPPPAPPAPPVVPVATKPRLTFDWG